VQRQPHQGEHGLVNLVVVDLHAATLPRRSRNSAVLGGCVHLSGNPVTFCVCVLAVLLWAAAGPYFHFSDAWQLVVNTATTILTFLMVFLIQNTQNRDGAAIQTKLNELIRASAARNEYIGIEHLTEEELDDLRAKFETRVGRSDGTSKLLVRLRPD
jgi:low affinity Fe/Cu permease